MLVETYKQSIYLIFLYKKKSMWCSVGEKRSTVCKHRNAYSLLKKSTQTLPDY